MPPRPAELPLRVALVRLFLIWLWALPADLPGQESPTGDSRVAGAVELSPRLIRINARTSPLFSVGASISFSDTWRAGGVGAFLLDRVPLDLPAPLEALELQLVYWGLHLERAFPLGSGSSPEVGARLLIGAGSVEVGDSATGASARSDNFLLLEPSLTLTRGIHRRASLGMVAGYRRSFGVDGLRDVRVEDLSGWSLGFLLRLGSW